MTQPVESTSVEIHPNIFWVGSASLAGSLNCNPYLIIDGNEGVLIDPGSPLDFADVLQNVKALIPLEKIRYIVLQHQDPDFCSSTPLFEKEGFQGKIATHWRAAQLIRFYGTVSPFYIVNENAFSLSFGNNRTLIFHPTPYLHFPGAITTYDSQSRILFSSDLFGAFAENRPLYADLWPDDSYMEAMNSFHEHYMPDKEILSIAMETFRHLSISQIAPQHGSIIRQDISRYIHSLSNLECGLFLQPIKKSLSPLDGYTHLVNQILRRCQTFFSLAEIHEIFEDTDIILDEVSGMIADFNSSGQELWHRFFQHMYHHLGASFLVLMEPLANRLSREYGVAMPDIYTSTRSLSEQSQLQLIQDTADLIEKNRLLEQKLQAASAALIQCPITQLPNETAFRQFLQEETLSHRQNNSDGALLFISIDRMALFNLRHGKEVGDELFRMLTLFFHEALPGLPVFKLDGPLFAVYTSDIDKSGALLRADTLRTAIQNSDRYIEPITATIGVINLRDFDLSYPENLPKKMIDTAKSLINLTRQSGGNQVAGGSQSNPLPAAGKILLVDTDTFHLEILSHLLSDSQFSVCTATNGEEALAVFEKESPNLIVSELLLPKTDAFALQERLLQYTGGNPVPFILLSFQKNETNIQRAFSLEIEHYLQKPYILAELMGLIRMKLRHHDQTQI